MRTLLLVVGACSSDGPKTDGHQTPTDTGSEPTTPPVVDTDLEPDTDLPPAPPCQAGTELRGLDIDVFGNIVRFGSFGAAGSFAPLAPVDSVSALLNQQEGLVDFDAGMFTVVTADAANDLSLLTVDATTGATVWEQPLATWVRGLHYDPANARVVGWGGGYGEVWSVGTVERETGAFVPIAPFADVASPHGGGRHALDAAGQRLFSVVSEGSGAFALYTIDLSTGDRIDRAEIASPFVDVMHLAYDESVGQLFAIQIVGGDYRLVTLDPSTAGTVVVGNPAGPAQFGNGNWRIFDPRTRLMWGTCSDGADSVCAVCTADGTVPVTMRTERMSYFAWAL